MDAAIEAITTLGPNAWSAIFTGGLLLTALITVGYAHGQWQSSQKHHKSQIKAQAEAVRPYVLVTVETSPAAFNLFDLVIRNIGKRPATDVVIQLDPPPIRAREKHELTPHMRNMKLLNEPMSLLAPDQEIRAFYDNHIERGDRDDLPVVHKVTVSYRDMSGTDYTANFTLDILALKGMTYTSVGTVHDVSKSLEKIAKTMSSAKVLQQSPELEVHAITEPRSVYDANELQDRYDNAKRAFDSSKSQEPDQGSTYHARVMTQMRAAQRDLAVQPLRRSGSRVQHCFNFFTTGLRTEIGNAVQRLRGKRDP